VISNSLYVHVFVFDGEDTATAVQYALFGTFSEKAQIELSLPEGVAAGALSVMDFMGNESALPSPQDGKFLLPLSRESVYLICTGPSAGDTLKRIYGGSPTFSSAGKAWGLLE